MKKLIFSVFAVVALASCGGGDDPAKAAQEVCDCFLKANKLPADDPNRNAEQTACLQKQTDAWNKYKDNAEQSGAFNDALTKCNDEVMKDALK